MNALARLLIALNIALVSAHGISATIADPMPLPKQLRIEGSLPRKKVWDRLNKKQKKFAYHLMLAGLEGKKLLAHQIHRHSQRIRTFIFDSVSKKQLDKTRKLLGEEGFQEYLVYCAKFLD